MSYIVYRLATAAVVLVSVSIVTFGFVYATPGDPAETILIQQTGQQPSAEAVEAFREENGLNDPVHHQYVEWVAGALQGDLGQSYYSDAEVSALIADKLPNTLELAVGSILVALVISIPAGVVSAVHQGTRFDYASQLGALIGVSMPSFWLGYLLILVFALYLGLYPVAGAGSFQYLVLPAVTLGTGMAAIVTRLVRTSMLDVLGKDYILTARSKGLRERIVIYKHALRNALLPVITIIGLQFAYVLNGAVVVEIVFQRPGLGTLLVDAVLARDYPVVQGVTLVTAVFFVGVNLVVDLTYSRLDPRIQIGDDREGGI